MEKRIIKQKKQFGHIKIVLICCTIVTIAFLYFLVDEQARKLERHNLAIVGSLLNDYKMDSRDALNIVRQKDTRRNYETGATLANEIVNYPQTDIDYTILYMIAGAMIVTMVSVYWVYKKQWAIQQAQLQKLIVGSECILEGDTLHLEVIDGEDTISVLSSKLYLLNERYYALVNLINKEKGKLKEYIEDITHQIKTPITSMRLNEELLLNTSLTDAQRTKVEYIYEQTTKITDLVDALLRLAKVESRSVQFVFKEESMLDIISEVENVLEPLLLKQQVSLEIEGEDQRIECDRTWMIEAIENIVKNSIEIKAHDCISIKLEENECFVYVTIQDHGPGFLQEDLEYIFNRFYRVDKTNTIGVGIGLALTKEIITLHHGTIEARNQEGACFKIALPKIKTKNKYAVTK